jgi:hypothetical protein
MLISPRIYSASQMPDRGQDPFDNEDNPTFHSLSGWSAGSVHSRRAVEMLLIHQTGSVRVGEVVRSVLSMSPLCIAVHMVKT